MITPYTLTKLHSRARMTLVIFLMLLSIESGLAQEKPTAAQGGPQQKVQSGEYIGPLELGRAVERELKGGATHIYNLNLASGQFVHVVVEQRGIDVVVVLIEPDGKKVIEVDSPNGTQGPEPVQAIIQATGRYRLEVRSQNEEAAGRYEVKLVELRKSTAEDNTLLSAQAERLSAIAEATGLHQQVEKLYGEGKYREAVPLAERELAIWERVLNPDHPNLAESLNNLAEVYRASGDYVHAELSFKRALAAFEKIHGPDHPNVALLLNNLALLYKGNGDYQHAQPLYQRALAIREKVLGSEHPDVALSLNNLAQLYRAKGDYAQAEALSVRALAIFERALGAEHPYVAGMLNNLAVLYSNMGNYERAELLYRRALTIREKVLGPEHPNVAESLSNLGVLYKETGDYLASEPLQRRALAIREKNLGPDHPLVANSLNELAALFKAKGDYASAEPLYRRALAIREKLFGPNHPDVADSINRIALLYQEKGDDAGAEALYQRALAIEEKALGPDHPDVALALNNLGSLYDEQGNPARAEPLYQRALAIFEKAFGHQHPHVATVLNNLGKMYADKSEYAQAESLQLKALAIRQKMFGAEHPDVALSLNNLAALYWSRKTWEAVRLQTQSNNIRERNLALLLTVGSEEQKRLYLKTFYQETNFTISLNIQGAPNEPLATRLAFTTILERKGRVLDAMANSIKELRFRVDPQDRALLDRLSAVRSQLATLLLNESGKVLSTTQQATAATLREEAEQLEGVISSRSAEFRTSTQPVTIASVQGAIPSGSMLVEIALYRPYDDNARKARERFGAPRYAAYVLSREDLPRWVDLGDAANIDRDVAALGRALSDQRVMNSSAVRRLARRLDEELMRPVRRLLGDTRRVFISPDGALNLLPFGALVDERGKYLIENYSFTYLTSGRDLLRMKISEGAESAAVLVGDPAFDVAVTTANASAPLQDTAHERRSADLKGAQLAPLPGTREEVERIKALLPKAQVLLGAEATEFATKQVSHPSILHVATHGFFLENETARSNAENPLLRSGLLLAGANKRQSGPGEDGVLTALEVAGLDLWGTRLVVLSACETGLGDVKNGEGVYGLRRALVLAGSETQVMSLWKVSDAGTRDLMTNYYQRLQRGEGRAEALWQVQLMMLRGQLKPTGGGKKRATTDTGEKILTKDYSHPYYWASFIQSGDWRSLNGK